MIWSVALFGHHKYKYELRERELSKVRLSKGTNYQGIEIFTDVFIHKTVGKFIDRPAGFNSDIYFIYEITGTNERAQPGDIIGIRPINHLNKWTPTEKKRFLIIFIDNLDSHQLIGITEPVWDLNSYPDMTDFDWSKTTDAELLLYPQKHLNKRRFSIELNVLENAGIDIQRMLDINELYIPDKIFDKSECFDKLNKRKIITTDNLNPIKPLIIKRP